MKNDGIGAAPFERPTPGTLAARLADAAGQGALCGYGETCQTRIGLAGNDAGGEDERTSRIEWIEPRQGVAQQEPRRQEAATGIVSPDAIVWFFDPRAALREIDMQDAAVVAKPRRGVGAHPYPLRDAQPI